MTESMSPQDASAMPGAPRFTFSGADNEPSRAARNKETAEEIARQVSEEINRLFASEIVVRAPRMRYWKTKKHAYAWTTERDSEGKFHALKYRVLKDGTWKLVKDVAFGRRKVAKNRAWRWYLADGARAAQEVPA